MYEQLIPNLRAVLEEKQLTPYQLAQKMQGNAKTNEPWLSRLLSGKIKQPRLDSIFSIANTLDVPVERLLGEGFQKNF